jgi:hypothetical protein
MIGTTADASRIQAGGKTEKWRTEAFDERSARRRARRRRGVSDDDLSRVIGEWLSSSPLYTDRLYFILMMQNPDPEVCYF